MHRKNVKLFKNNPVKDINVDIETHNKTIRSSSSIKIKYTQKARSQNKTNQNSHSNKQSLQYIAPMTILDAFKNKLLLSHQNETDKYEIDTKNNTAPKKQQGELTFRITNPEGKTFTHQKIFIHQEHEQYEYPKTSQFTLEIQKQKINRCTEELFCCKHSHSPASFYVQTQQQIIYYCFCCGYTLKSHGIKINKINKNQIIHENKVQTVRERKYSVGNQSKNIQQKKQPLINCQKYKQKDRYSFSKYNQNKQDIFSQIIENKINKPINKAKPNQQIMLYLTEVQGFLQFINKEQVSIETEKILNQKNYKKTLNAYQRQKAEQVMKIQKLYQEKVMNLTSEYGEQLKKFEQTKQNYKDITLQLQQTKADIIANLHNISKDNIFSKDQVQTILQTYWQSLKKYEEVLNYQPKHNNQQLYQTFNNYTSNFNQANNFGSNWIKQGTIQKNPVSDEIKQPMKRSKELVIDNQENDIPFQQIFTAKNKKKFDFRLLNSVTSELTSSQKKNQYESEVKMHFKFE